VDQGGAPLVLVFIAVAFVVTVIFRADVEAQGGAYATGVLVLMTSAAVAVTLSVRRRGRRWPTAVFVLITLVFLYTTVVNVIERPDGVRIGSFFITAIVVTSVVSRVSRATELRVTGVLLDKTPSAWSSRRRPRATSASSPTSPTSGTSGTSGRCAAPTTSRPMTRWCSSR
jgi:hypothetical protein